MQRIKIDGAEIVTEDGQTTMRFWPSASSALLMVRIAERMALRGLTVDVQVKSRFLSNPTVTVKSSEEDAVIFAKTYLAMLSD